MSIARYISKLGALLNSNGQVQATGLAAGAARANFGAGAVLQVIQSTTSTSTSSTSNSYVDASGLSVTITPTSATSKFLIFLRLGHFCAS